MLRTTDTGRIRLFRPLLGLVLGLLLAALGVIAPGHAGAQSTDESNLYSATNQSRWDQNMGGVQYDAAASNVARAWSQHQASSGSLAHNPNLVSQVNQQVTTEWTRLGENVGYGGSVAQVQQAFMNSTAHRNNILGDYNRVGVGTARSASGTLWVTVIFIKGPSLTTGPPPANPFGQLDVAAQVLGGVRVSGWALDPDTSSPIEVHVYIDNWGTNTGAASRPRPDVGAAFPAAGDAHGFDTVLNTNPGPHNVCAYGINVAGGSNTLLGCRTIFVNRSPFGSFDFAGQVLGGVRVTGWAIDPDTNNPIEVHVYVDQYGANLGQASKTRSDVGNAFAYAGYGAAHGFDSVVGASPGGHWVCAYGINTSAGANTLLGCKWIVVNPSPFGNFEAATPVQGGIRVSGWTIDPDTSNPVEVHVYVGSWGSNLGLASGSRQDVGNAFAYAGYGASHGFSATIPASAGKHQVCAYGINVSSGANSLLGCRTVNVTN